MNKYIVITSINAPTEAVKRFCKFDEHSVIVVGDKKSPSSYILENCNFLSVEDQKKCGFLITNKLGYNHYSRKMIGYLEAIRKGANVIIDTDDDNIPYDDWCFPGFTGEFDKTKSNLGFVNVYELFTEKKIWPRGLPLSLINRPNNTGYGIEREFCNIGIWQGLADEDPDVDAIYRLVDDSPCYFNKRDPVVCAPGTISPFNTQNTIIKEELFALLYLPVTVTFRFTDILRGLIAQPIMWLYGYELGFTQASVIQKRNPHDYFKDFLSEIPMYQLTERVIDIVKSSISVHRNLEDNLLNSYRSLANNKIVEAEELLILEDWIQDIKNCRR